MAASPDYVTTVHALLNQTLQPDTDTVKAAEEGLAKLTHDPALVPALFQIIVDAPEDGVRQSASLGLQKRVPEVWDTLSAPVRDQMKSKLLHLAIAEPKLPSSVRSSVAQVIGAVASAELPAGAWPQLVPTVVGQVRKGRPEQKVSALSLLYVLLDTLPVEDSWGMTEPEVASLLASTLVGPDSLDSRVLSVRGLGKLEETADAVTEQVYSLFPAMVQVLHQALEAANEQGVKQILEVLDMFFLSPAVGLTQYLAELLDFYLSTAAKTNVDEELREAFLNSAIWTVAHKSSRVQQLELVPRLLVQTMAIVTTDELDEDASNPAMTALTLIATLARDLAPTQIWPTLQSQLHKFASSLDPAYRSAGLLSLGACADGMSVTLGEHLDLVWAVLEAGLADTEPCVQQAALACLSDLCEEMGSDLVPYHKTVMQALLTLIGHPVTQTQAARALGLYLEYLDSDISLYLRPVMETLAGHLDTSSLAVRKTLIAAIGSAACAAREEFVPYLAPVMDKLTPYLTSIDETDEDQVEFRAVTQDVVGTLAEAVEEEHFRPYFAPSLELAYNALSLQQPVLRESSYLFFGSVAKVYGAEFDTFLPKIVPKLLEALKLHDGQHESEVPDDDWDSMPSETSSPIVAEKQAAMEAVGDLFKATQAAYAPYLQDSAEALIALLTHSSPDLRKTAVEVLFNLADTLYAASDLPPWKPGAVLQVPVPVEMEQLIDAIMANVVNIWGDEANDLVAMQVCQSLADSLEIVGPALIHKYLADVNNMAVSVLAKTSLPQVVESGDGEEEHDEDSTEFETLYVKSAMDLVGAMADALGADLSRYLPQLLPELAKYLDAGRSNAERKAALTTLGSVVAGMKASIQPFVPDLFPLLSRGLLDPDAPSRTAAIYAIGVLIQFTERNLGAYYQTVVEVLNTSLSLPNVDEQPSDLRAQRDNAVGCLARMVRKQPHVLPLNQTLSLVFGALPMLEDIAEWTPVVQMCLSLLAAHDAVAEQHADGMLCVFADVLGLAPDDGSPLDDDLQTQIIDVVRSLHTQIPAQVEAAGLEQYLS